MRKKSLLFLKLIVTSIIVLVLYHNISAEQILSTFQKLHWTELVLLFPLIMVNTILNTWKWRTLLNAMGIFIPFRSLLSSQMIGCFVSIFMPSNIGGDAYRAYAVGQHSSKPVRSLASVVADRISGLLTLAFCGFLSAVIGFNFDVGLHVVLPPLLVFVSILTGVILLLQKTLLMNVMERSGLLRVEKIRNFVEKLLGAFQIYAERPLLLVKVLLISLCFYFIMVVYVYLIALVLGFHIPFVDFCMYVPLIALMEAIPLSIYGVGFRDAGYVLFFAEVGYSSADALSMSLIYVSLNLLFSGLGGLLLARRTFWKKQGANCC